MTKFGRIFQVTFLYYFFLTLIISSINFECLYLPAKSEYFNMQNLNIIIIIHVSQECETFKGTHKPIGCVCVCVLNIYLNTISTSHLLEL